MPKKKPPDPNEKPQIERFIEKAKELGVDETGAEFDRAMKKVAPTKPRKPLPR